MKPLGPQEYKRHHYHAPRSWKEATGEDDLFIDEVTETSWLWWITCVFCFVVIVFSTMLWWGE